jgi:hypothetical protein
VFDNKWTSLFPCNDQTKAMIPLPYTVLNVFFSSKISAAKWRIEDGLMRRYQVIYNKQLAIQLPET